ncbi:uncharacterized protein K452DRAFT_95646 [Aplosporella prunicola CBS 121167]|uniref:Uncharacterized protein n=1 Tax=Aplosporella prunicola CBS 121167 TaxID=1176127 RepID=A0A6A6B4J6_9PEZI|nr:uncharacterized protein K452DRAFT_95646 [Aplosporella prunicola CBS 121167]KAF2138134.1 hypothetical protein K452DRAFT_95646 [Aplosporella prunicola CBS 121167]
MFFSCGFLSVLRIYSFLHCRRGGPTAFDSHLFFPALGIATITTSRDKQKTGNESGGGAVTAADRTDGSMEAGRRKPSP